MSYTFAPPYDTRDYPNLTHEDRQHLAQTYGWAVTTALGVAYKHGIRTTEYVTRVRAEDLAPHIADPVVQKLAAFLVKERLRAAR